MIRRMLQSLLCLFLSPLLVAQQATGSGQIPFAPVSHPVTQSKGRSITLRRGTVVPLTPLESASSATAQLGQAVRYAVSEDMAVDGIVVIPRGTPVSGGVIFVRKAVLGQQNGRVAFEPVSLALADGSSIPLREAPSTDGEAQGLAGVALLIAGLPFLFIDMFRENHPAPEPGDDETLPSCRHLWGSTTKSVRINLAVLTQALPWSSKVDVDSACPALARRVPSVTPIVLHPE